MSNEYLDRYHIIETYKDNHQQKILIASTKDEKKEAVIINIIKDIEAFEGLDEETLGKVFLNLLDFQKNSQEVVLVGALKDALPLDTYLSNKNPTPKERMDLIYAYLMNIVRYDGLSENMISQLVDVGQLVVEKDEIALDELIIFPEEELEEKASAIEKVIRVVDKIFVVEASEYMDYIYQEQITLFKEELLGAETPASLNDIFKAFRKRYIYAYCLEGFEEPKKGKAKRAKTKPEVDVDHTFLVEASKNRFFGTRYKGLIAIGLVLTLALTVFAGYHILTEDTEPVVKAPVEKLPLPYFDVVQRDGEWEFINKSQYEDFLKEQLNISWQVSREGELLKTFQREDLKIVIDEPGTYMVTLIISDLKDRWQREYSEEIVVDGNGPAEAINQQEDVYIGAENLLDKAELLQGMFGRDFERIRDNSHTYKISESPTTIELETSGIKNGSILSFWVLMETQETIEIKITGYKHRLIDFQEVLEHRPKAVGYWEMLQLSLEESGADKIAIDFSSFSKPIWLDDLELSIVK